MMENSLRAARNLFRFAQRGRFTQHAKGSQSSPRGFFWVERGRRRCIGFAEMFHVQWFQELKSLWFMGLSV